MPTPNYPAPLACIRDTFLFVDAVRVNVYVWKEPSPLFYSRRQTELELMAPFKELSGRKLSWIEIANVHSLSC
jgi:hypothetical protein